MRGLELLLTIGLFSGWWIAHGEPWFALGAAVAGAWVWCVWDEARLRRLLAWLARPDLTREPALRGIWSELISRIHKLRKRLEGQVADADQRLSDFMEAIQTSPNGVVLLDGQARIEWCNQTAADQLGIDPERDHLQHVTNLVRNPVFTQYLQATGYGHEVFIDGARSTPTQPMTLAVRLHGYGAGRRLMLLRDVTAHQQAEAMRRDFVANVSHEIRTPLTVLSGFVETLQTLDIDDAQRAQYLELMAQQSRRMEGLVADLLTLSKLEGSPLPGRLSGVDVDAWLQRCVADAQALSSVLTQKGHLWLVDRGWRGQVVGNPDELGSALANLLSNAVRYTPEGGTIRIQAGLSSTGQLEIAVSDSGPGIAPEHLPRLSERFYRVDRSRSRDTGGTGLGLAIVKHVVQRHGGQLRIHSQLGQGSVFTLVLPADRLKPQPPA